MLNGGRGSFGQRDLFAAIICMKAIDGIDLKDLVTETMKELVAEKQRSVQGFIKDLLKRYEYLILEVDQKRKQLVQAEDSLKKTKEKIDKLQAGDWSMLELLIKNPQQIVNKQKEKEQSVDEE